MANGLNDKNIIIVLTEAIPCLPIHIDFNPRSLKIIRIVAFDIVKYFRKFSHVMDLIQTSELVETSLKGLQVDPVACRGQNQGQCHYL